MISYIQGDLFAAPSNSILVHACNTQGSWGSGIALAFRNKFPKEYEQYRAHCKSHDGRSLVGTCLLIPGDKYDVACLFTSRSYGRYKDTPVEILIATSKAVEDLMNQNVSGKPLHAWYVEISEMIETLRALISHSCVFCSRFNSGKFAVPWADTEAVLDDLNVSMIVYTPA